MNNKNENPTDSFISDEKRRIKDDQEFIKCVKDCLVLSKKQHKKRPKAHRIEKLIKVATDLIQFEESILEARIKSLPLLFPGLKENPLSD